jgi:hypothetical protein
MYYVIQNIKHIFIYLFIYFSWTKYEKKNDVERNKMSSKHCWVKYIKLQDLDANVFNSSMV